MEGVATFISSRLFLPLSRLEARTYADGLRERKKKLPSSQRDSVAKPERNRR